MIALRVLALAALVWLAAAWGASQPGQSGLLGAKPDLVLVAVALVASAVSPVAGAGYGLLAAVLVGGSSGADLTAFGVSLTVTGFAVSMVSHRAELKAGPVMWAGAVLAATLLSRGLLLFLAPPPDIGGFLGATMGTAICNGAIAGIVGALLRKWLKPQVD